MKRTDSVEECIDEVIAKVGHDLRVGTALGIGKPNHLLNALYRRVRADSRLQLTIYTALTFERPKANSELERRFVEPFVERVFGNYPDLDYELDRVAGRLPPNVRVREFYLQPGRYLRAPSVQRDYICTNYTYVARDLLDRGVNVIMQQVGVLEDGEQLRLSLSCNADVTPDLMDVLCGRPDTAVVCQTNEELPFMPGDAEVSPERFDVVVHDPAQRFTLFSTPNEEISDTDMMIGLYASTLVQDGGELQLGIGALGDAVTYALCLRQRDNPRYRAALAELEVTQRAEEAIARLGSLEPFERGVFAATEMLVDGFQHLWEAGILKRVVYDDAALQHLLNEDAITEDVTSSTLEHLLAQGAIEPRLSERDVAYLKHFGVLRESVRCEHGELWAGDRQLSPDLSDSRAFQEFCAHALGDRLRHGAVAHAGFFLGPRSFYQWLRSLPMEERALFQMRSVTRINQLYGQEVVGRLQRVRGRFLNTGMLVTLSGAVVSDGLEDGRVVSGVGGQHDFVAMAHALPDGHAVIQVRATRDAHGTLVSNIVAGYGHTTLPRHQRDVVVTEYGVAMLRGKTDEEVVQTLLNVADSRFQDELLHAARESGKVAPDYQIPERFRHNLPEAYAPALGRLRAQGLFPRFPFGSDFTPEEEVLARALKRFARQLEEPKKLLETLGRAALARGGPDLTPYLSRMGLRRPRTLQELLYRQVLVAMLRTDPALR